MSGQTTILAGLGVSGNTQGENVTRYWPVFGGYRPSSSEAQAQLPIRAACTIKNLTTYLSANGLNVANSAVFTVRKSGADTGITVSYSALQSGRKQDIVNTSSFADTDELSVKCVTADPAGSGTLITITDISVEMVPDASSTALSALGCYSAGGLFSTASATRYILPAGTYSLQTSEAQCQLKASRHSTLQDMWVYVLSNSRGTTTTFHLRKNGANGSQSVTYTSLQTGLKEDNANTDALEPGDLFCLSIETGSGTDNITIVQAGVWMSSDEGVGMLSAGLGAGVSLSAGVTNYMPVGGPLVASVSTEANVEHLPKIGFVAKDLQTYVAANTLSSDCTITLRDNGADSSLAVTYAAGQTGWKVDNDETTMSDADEFAAKVVTSSGSGSITLHSVSVTTLAAFDRTKTPTAADVTASGPTVFAAALLSPTEASVVSSGPSATIAMGGINRFISTGTPVRSTAQTVAVSHGGITRVPDIGAFALSAPAPSISHGEAILGVGAPGPLLTPPEVSLAHGGATRSPGEASLAFSAPDPTLAIDTVGVLGTAGAVISPPEPLLAFGDLVLGVDPASVSISGSSVGIGGAMTLVLSTASFQVGTDQASVGLAYAIKTDETILAFSPALVAHGKLKTITPDDVGLTVSPTSVSLGKGAIVLTPSAPTILTRCFPTSREPEMQGQAFGCVAYCATAYDVDAACLVATMVDVACLVSPDDVANMTTKTTTSSRGLLEEETA